MCAQARIRSIFRDGDLAESDGSEWVPAEGVRRALLRPGYNFALQVDPERHSLVLPLKTTWSRRSRERIVCELFEGVGVPSLAVTSQAHASLLGVGCMDLTWGHPSFLHALFM